jgi:hypothetical protein
VNKSLKDLGISKMESSRWQALSAIPERKFEEAVKAAKQVAGEVTTAFVRRYEESRTQALGTSPGFRAPSAPSNAPDAGLLASVVAEANAVINAARQYERSGIRGKKPGEYRETMRAAKSDLRAIKESLS